MLIFLQNIKMYFPSDICYVASGFKTSCLFIAQLYAFLSVYVLTFRACFLTSSLMGTLAISLTIPMTMFADVVFRRADYSFVYYVGTVPIFVSFFGVAFLTHWENWDPVLFALKKGLHYACRCRNAYSSK